MSVISFRLAPRGAGIAFAAPIIPEPTPMGDMTVVYIEADDLDTMFAGLGSSQDPFDVWFREQTREQTREIHGIELEDGLHPLSKCSNTSPPRPCPNARGLEFAGR